MMRRIFWRVSRPRWGRAGSRFWLRGMREGGWLFFSFLFAGLALVVFLLYVFNWFFR